MNVIAASRRKEITYMKTFTIDAENNISVFASKKEAAAASTPFDPFTSQDELAELSAEWPMSRLVETWNSIPGVNPVTKFTNRKVAAERIWKAIQGLGETSCVAPADASAPAPEPQASQLEPEAAPIVENPEPPAPEPEQIGETPESKPVEEPPAQLADAGAQAPDVAPAETASKGRAKKAPKAPKVAEAPKAESGPREGSKTAQVVEMLKRDGGATLTEIMEKMGWQKHTVAGSWLAR
jgi:hypothetical protein